MEMAYYLYPGAAILAFAAAFFLTRLRARTGKKQIPETYFGAIRVTDKEGRDLLIVRKDDGSFEMIDEEKARKG
ncbi:MAG: hypothetical protein WAW37_04115 [Syntrophobacteraceae bacterium]